MVEGLRIEADENGWQLVIEGDLVEECEAYLASEGLTLRLNIHGVAFEFAGSEGLLDLHEWRAEGLAARRDVSRARDDADAYAPDDPKSPGYYDRMAELEDLRDRGGR